MNRILKSLLLLVFINGCTDQSALITQPEMPVNYEATFDSINISDSLLVSLAYSTNKYPEGFYQEDLNGASIYYENTLSILPTDQRTSHATELSTNDRDQAFAWSESTAVHSSYYRKLESESETDKYFQFRRVYEQRPSDVILDRVHKLSYVDRSMYDSFNRTPRIAKMNISPIDTLSVKEFVEYIWYVWNYNIYGSKAIATVSRQSNDSTWCVLYSLGESMGDWGMQDEIFLYRSVYSVSRQTGNVIYSSSLLRTIKGIKR